MKKVFKAEEGFQSYYKAEKFLDDNGYSYGSSDTSAYVAIWKGDCYISKWRNLSPKERSTCHGLITGDKRNGPVTVTIKDEIWNTNDKHIEKHHCLTCMSELVTWKTEDAKFIGTCVFEGCSKIGKEVALLEYPPIIKVEVE